MRLGVKWLLVSCGKVFFFLSKQRSPVMYRSTGTRLPTDPASLLTGTLLTMNHRNCTKSTLLDAFSYCTVRTAQIVMVKYAFCAILKNIRDAHKVPSNHLTTAVQKSKTFFSLTRCIALQTVNYPFSLHVTNISQHFSHREAIVKYTWCCISEMCHVSHISHSDETAFATPCIPSLLKWHHGNTYIYVCRPISTITLNSCCVERAANPRLPCFCPLAVSLTLEWSPIRQWETQGQRWPNTNCFLESDLNPNLPCPPPYQKHTHKTMSYTALLPSSFTSEPITGFPKPPCLSLAPIKYIIEAPFIICRCPWVHPEEQDKCTRGGWLGAGHWRAVHLHFNTLKDSIRSWYNRILLKTCSDSQPVCYDLKR